MVPIRDSASSISNQAILSSVKTLPDDYFDGFVVAVNVKDAEAEQQFIVVDTNAVITNSFITEG